MKAIHNKGRLGGVVPATKMEMVKVFYQQRGKVSRRERLSTL